MKSYLTESSPFADSNASAHFKAGSALSEFMADRLGAPSFWPDGIHRKNLYLRLPDEVSSIQRWENEGGKAVAPARAKCVRPAVQLFRPGRSFLTQPI
jgi:hypothetical protein